MPLLAGFLSDFPAFLGAGAGEVANGSAIPPLAAFAGCVCFGAAGAAWCAGVATFAGAPLAAGAGVGSILMSSGAGAASGAGAGVGSAFTAVPLGSGSIGVTVGFTGAGAG